VYKDILAGRVYKGILGDMDGLGLIRQLVYI